MIMNTEMTDKCATKTEGDAGSESCSSGLLGRVYVDAPVWPFGRMMMCHMLADHLEDLHKMADKIGVARRWFQNKPGFPHYDICKSKRALAVRFGAREISREEFVSLVKRPNAAHERPPEQNFNAH